MNKPICVNSSGQGNSLSLTAGKVNASLANFGFVPSWKDGDIHIKSTCRYNAIVPDEIISK